MRLPVGYGIAASVFVLAVLCAACGSPAGQVRTNLTIHRPGWDTVRVDVSFVRRTLLGDTATVPPDTAVRYVLFDADYDTLHAGTDPVLPVPDARLGDREPLIVEVCGDVRGKAVCDQAGLHASPKRIRTSGDISYPDDSDFEEGRFAVDFIVERQAIDSTGWEPVDAPAQVAGYLMAYVADQSDPPVKVPMQAARGRFDLTRFEGYDDFRYHLRSRLLDAKEAQVRFDVYAGLSARDVRQVATIEKQVRHKTDADRREEVRYFVEQAADRILDGLRIPSREARVYIDGWSFDPKDDVYQVELDLEWGRGFFSRTHEMEGRLHVQEDGRQARFRATRGSRRARDHWRDYVDAHEMDLGSFEALSLEELSQDGRASSRREPMAWSH